VMGLSVIGFSVPVFVIGYVLIQIFAIDLRWLPVQGFQSITRGLGPFLQRIILPTITLSFIYVALIARMTRASMLDVLGEDYVRTARAKGINETGVLLRHALRNAAVPVITVIGRGFADFRRRRHRKRVQPAGHRPSHRRCRAGSRLSSDPGHDPVDLRHLCRGQSLDRSRLHPA
jgi:ABC-type antimicrobial peptide transport system permease subunit